MTGTKGWVRDYPYDQICQMPLKGGAEHAPLFSEFLQTVDGKTPLIIEIKSRHEYTGEYLDALCHATLDGLKGYNGPYCIESFDPRVVKRIRKFAPQVLRGQLVDSYRAYRKEGANPIHAFVISHCFGNFMARPDFIAWCPDKQNWAVRLWRMLLQEDLEQRTVSVSIQAAKLSGRVLRAAIAAVLQKMEQERTMPRVGRNSMKRLTYKDPGANTIEVSGRIRSFERYARKHQVRYHIEKELGTDPPKWTVYFKANQADALTAAFKEYTKKDLTRSTRPSLLTQLHKFKELAQSLGRDRVKNKEHGGPER